MIGYYVHHHGSGHLHRMLSVSARLRGPVTVLSSLPRPSGCALPWVRLSPDDAGRDPQDVDARGTLHWVPRYHDGLRARMAQISCWLEQVRPELVVVDVSVEVALQCRLAGVPVVVTAMPGNRSDRAHCTAYDLADALLAPWPRSIGLERLPSPWPSRWTGKTIYAGAISRFEGWARPCDPRPVGTHSDRPRALLLWGTGGGAPTGQDVERLVRATPAWQWDLAVPKRPLGGAQVWEALCRADVVVSHAGQNSVAEIATARTPAVLVAAERPFDEQLHTAHALDQAGLAVGLRKWPRADLWEGHLREAVRRGGTGWRAWTEGGAGRAAAGIEAVADRLRQAGADAPAVRLRGA